MAGVRRGRGGEGRGEPGGGQGGGSPFSLPLRTPAARATLPALTAVVAVMSTITSSILWFDFILALWPRSRSNILLNFYV